MKLSIIVPIFNVELYIAKCALSLLNQTVLNDEYEVIFINDGTKDNSIEILKKTIDFKNIKHFYILEKENGGLSSARNYGIDHSKGDYIWFVDSDDWIEDECLQGICNVITDQDVLAFESYHKVTAEKNVTVGIQEISGKGTEFTKVFYYHCAPFYIFKRSFINRIGFRFKCGIYHEDVEFTPRALYLAERIDVYKIPVYYYLQREGSITQSVNPQRILDLISIIETHLSFGEAVVAPEDFRYWSRNAIGAIVNNLLKQKMECTDKGVVEIANNYVDSRFILTRIMIYSQSVNSRIMGYLSFLLGGRLSTVHSILSKFRYKNES